MKGHTHWIVIWGQTHNNSRGFHTFYGVRLTIYYKISICWQQAYVCTREFMNFTSSIRCILFVINLVCMREFPMFDLLAPVAAFITWIPKCLISNRDDMTKDLIFLRFLISEKTLVDGSSTDLRAFTGVASLFVCLDTAV